VRLCFRLRQIGVASKARSIGLPANNLRLDLRYKYCVTSPSHPDYVVVSGWSHHGPVIASAARGPTSNGKLQMYDYADQTCKRDPKPHGNS
jgi:hypothetical protein